MGDSMGQCILACTLVKTLSGEAGYQIDIFFRLNSVMQKKWQCYAEAR
jgi:hypothetical protein